MVKASAAAAGTAALASAHDTSRPCHFRPHIRHRTVSHFGHTTRGRPSSGPAHDATNVQSGDAHRCSVGSAITASSSASRSSLAKFSVPMIARVSRCASSRRHSGSGHMSRVFPPSISALQYMATHVRWNECSHPRSIIPPNSPSAVSIVSRQILHSCPPPDVRWRAESWRGGEESRMSSASSISFAVRRSFPASSRNSRACALVTPPNSASSDSGSVSSAIAETPAGPDASRLAMASFGLSPAATSAARAMSRVTCAISETCIEMVRIGCSSWAMAIAGSDDCSLQALDVLEVCAMLCTAVLLYQLVSRRGKVSVSVCTVLYCTVCSL
eukprot:m.133810 g.133810  ORF g.133810 m.133810 type:complete len:329 (-) comp22501_c1_seq5:381-1367(-)